jgi:hypothetical protein
MNEERLWRYFSEVRAAVEAANRGQESQPYRRGTFMVTAVAGDVELTVSDVSEEDAVLIAGELKAMGVKALVSGSVICPACGKRVPEQRYCVQCRARL